MEYMTLTQAAKEYPGIGRRRLMALTGRTAWACAEFLKGCPEKPKQGRQSATAAPAAPTPRAPVAGMISLTDKRVLDVKPADTVKRLLYGLKRGVGYPVDMLVDMWGFSRENICRHAKRESALKYVETSPGEWVHCVMHPDTAEDYRKATK